MSDKRRSGKPWVIRVSSSILEALAAERLPHRHLRVLLVLESFTRDATRCWPNNRTLARLAVMSVRSPQEVLTDLEQWGFIRRHEGKQKARESIEMLRRLYSNAPVVVKASPPHATTRTGICENSHGEHANNRTGGMRDSAHGIKTQGISTQEEARRTRTSSAVDGNDR